MPTQVPDLLPPSRLTGDSATDQQIIMDFLWTYYRALKVALDSVASLGPLATEDIAVSDFELLANKNKASGYVGLSSSYQLTIKNAAGTISSTLSSVAAAARSYVLPDAAGTIALTSDLTGFESAANKNAASGYAGLSSTYQIQFLNNAGTFTSLFTNANTAARTYTFQNSDGVIAMIGNITGGALAAAFTDLAVSGVLTTAASTSVASATTLDLSANATGNIVPVTGTTPVEVITMPVGSMTIIPAAALPLVYDATTCKLIGGVDYTCEAGEPVELRNDGTTVFAFPHGVGKAVYGSMYLTADLTPAATTWTKAACSIGGIVGCSGVTFDDANDKLIIQRTGIYLVSLRDYYHNSGTATSPGYGAVYVNGAFIGIQCTARQAALSTPVKGTDTGTIPLSAGDEVQLYLYAGHASGTFTSGMANTSLELVRVGD